MSKGNKHMPITKTCSKCGMEKECSNFYKHPKTKDGLNSWCKECSHISSRNYGKKKSTKYTSIIRNRWNSINQRCINGCYKTPNAPQFQSYTRKGITINMSKEEFTIWMLSVENTHNQIVSKGEKSSIDRIDDTKGYEIGNLQLISLHDNIEKRIGEVCKYSTSEAKLKKIPQNKSMYNKFKNKEFSK